MRLSTILLLGGLLILGCEDQVVAPEASSHLDDNTHARLYETHKGGKAVLNFTAPLNGNQEVPPVDTKATGLAKFQLSKDGTALSYKLIVANIEDVLMAHIHVAPAGQNGPVAVWLYPDAPPPVLIPGRSNGVLAEGTITATNLVGPLAGEPLSALLEVMSGGGTYVNVHTTAHPPGEIRGQVVHGNGVY